MNGAISNQRKSGTEIEVATVMITRVRMNLFLAFSWKGFMHVCIVNMYCVYCMYGAIRRSQQDWDLSGEQREQVCVVKSQDIHDQLRKTSPQKKCQKNILYYNLWRNVFLNYIKWGHPCWQYLCNQSKDFQYNNHQSECFLEWIDEESQKYPTLLLSISCLCLVSALFLVNVMNFVLPSTSVILSRWKILEQKL